MTFSSEEQKAIKELEGLNTDEQIEQIKRISLSAWDGRLETLSLNSWLNNFSGEYFENKKAEVNLALWLVQHFVFYTDQDIRSLSVNLWWKYIHILIEEYYHTGFMCDKSIDEKCKYILQNTLIQPLGNCGESGTNICYFFRQANGLKKELFDVSYNPDYLYLVLVDDATVSGHQAEEDLEKYKSLKDKQIYILTYISTERAKNHIGDSAHVISSIEMDDKSRCFDSNSYVFSRHKNWIEISKKLCKYYGQKINPYNPLGYRKGQYLFGFYYNIPNNTLPIFWATLGGWVPLFNRYFSEYDNSGEKRYEKFV